MANNLFSKARKTAKTTTKVKDEKIRLNVDDSGEFFDKIQMVESLQDKIKSAEAKVSMLTGEIKEVGKDLWSKQYLKMGKNPGSVMLESKKGDDVGQVMFIPMDKYITINSDRADELRDEFGEDIVEENTTFAFDNDMIEKYGEVLSNLIEMSDDISDDDKGKIIKAVTKFNISKGTIDKFKDYGDIIQVMEATKPVLSLKGASVIKG